ncbi:phage/plasmid replication domain-containing protein [Phormidesmis sp. 146-33]
MIDTLKLGIPLSESQYKRIRQVSADCDRWQWVLLNEFTGDLLFRRVSGMAKTDGESFHRELRWDLPSRYEPDCKLSLEFSVPKYWYGHNIHLLYDFVAALRHLKRSLETQFKLKTRALLPDVMTWQVFRVDICYTWKFPSQQSCHNFLESLKRIHFPRKKPIIYPTALMFAGTTYSLKFYEKLPEFKQHDRKALLKSRACLSWVDHCESLADGVLRVEATLRRQYLKLKELHTIEDLLRPFQMYEWPAGEMPESHEEQLITVFLASTLKLEAKGIDTSSIQNDGLEPSSYTPLYDGMEFPVPPFEAEFNGTVYKRSNPITLTFRKQDNLVVILQYLLTKFVGSEAKMQTVDQVQLKLMEFYKPVKAARLVSVWLYVQRFSSAEAREVFGRQSFDYSKRQMKKAGVSLIEPPHSRSITIVEKDFFQNFRLEIPSPHVTNKVDDFRDSGNVLNFVPKMSGYDERA